MVGERKVAFIQSRLRGVHVYKENRVHWRTTYESKAGSLSHVTYDSCKKDMLYRFENRV